MYLTRPQVLYKTYLVVPFEDVDSLAFNEVHGLAGFGHEGGQRVEDVTLLDIGH